MWSSTGPLEPLTSAAVFRCAQSWLIVLAVQLPAAQRVSVGGCDWPNPYGFSSHLLSSMPGR